MISYSHHLPSARPLAATCPGPPSPLADHGPGRAWSSEPGIADGLVEALDWLEQGIALVAGDGRVLFATSAARGFMSRERGLTISDGLLQARSSAEAAALRHLIARCASSGAGEELGDSPVLSCRAGDPSLLLLMARVARTTAVDGHHGIAVLFIVDPTQTCLPNASTLRQHFGLTAAEAAVAVDVISGEGLKASSRRLGVSVETARTHLRHIFAKTGVRRQAELVRLLLSARHAVRRPGKPSSAGAGAET